MNAPSDVTLAWLQRARSDLQLGRAALRTKGVMPKTFFNPDRQIL